MLNSAVLYLCFLLNLHIMTSTGRNKSFEQYSGFLHTFKPSACFYRQLSLMASSQKTCMIMNGGLDNGDGQVSVTDHLSVKLFNEKVQPG